MRDYSKIKNDRLENILYTCDHRIAFRKVEKELLGHNTLLGLFHDIEKIFMYMVLKEETVNKLHTKYSNHHDKACKRKHYIQQIIDYECARYTKPDKPLGARDFIYKTKTKQEIENIYEPLLKEFSL